jgi:hypothetical protein
MSSKPHELSVDEVRNNFLDHVRGIVEYWNDESRVKSSTKERLEGVAFSILVALDGGSAGLPGFVVAPSPHPDDKDYCKMEGENWYPKAPVVKCDIAGCLHELFYKKENK